VKLFCLKTVTVRPNCRNIRW